MKGLHGCRLAGREWPRSRGCPLPPDCPCWPTCPGDHVRVSRGGPRCETLFCRARSQNTEMQGANVQALCLAAPVRSAKPRAGASSIARAQLHPQSASAQGSNAPAFAFHGGLSHAGCSCTACTSRAATAGASIASADPRRRAPAAATALHATMAAAAAATEDGADTVRDILHVLSLSLLLLSAQVALLNLWRILCS